MPTTASGSFDKIYNYDGVSTYTDITLTVQALNSTAVNILDTSAYELYLGHTEKFDMAIFDLATAGSLGALTWKYWNGSAWTEFTPSIDRELPDEDPYSFDTDGAETIPYHLIPNWQKNSVNSVSKYWIQVTTASVTTVPTVRRIQMRAINAYATTKEIFEFLQMEGVFSTPGDTVTDFGDDTIPSKSSVQAYISGAQAEIDYKTRKSWKPNVIYHETHEFDYNGIKLDRRGATRMFKLELWNGASFDLLTEGRNEEYYFDRDTGMIHFSRFYFLPARFGAVSGITSRFGGGEFLKPVRASYQYGDNVNLDHVAGGYVHELTRKLAAIAIVRNSDFGNITTGGMDRITLGEKVTGWHSEVQDGLESLRAVELF